MDAELARLSVVIDARMDRLEDKLNKAVRASYAASSKMEKAFNKAALGKNLAGQFDQMATSSQAGALSLDLLGEAALPLAGILTAASIAANQAMQAMKWGDTLDAQAAKLRISAERLQELQFAADETDVPIEALETGLAKLNTTLGALKLGKGDAKIKAFAEELGIDRASLKSINDASAFLPILADRIRKVKSTAEQARIAKAFGVEELLPLLRRGSEGLTEMSQRARELGLVLSDETVTALADANREMELAGQQIQANLRGAFAGLAVDIAASTTALAQFVQWARQLVQDHPKIAGALETLNRFALGPAGLIRDRAGALLRGLQARTTAGEIRDAMAGGLPQSAWGADVPADWTADENTGGDSGGGGGGGGSSRTRSAGADVAARQKLIALEEQLAAAEAAGDSRRVAALREQLEIERLIARYRSSGFTDAQAQAKAQEQAAVQRTALELEGERRRWMIELEDELEIARERGDKRRIQALEDQLEVVRLMERYLAAGYDRMEATVRATSQVRAQSEARDAATEWEASVVRPEQNVELDDPLEPKVVRGGRLMTPEEDEAVRRQWADAIGGGLRAAIHGGTPALAEYFAQTMTEALINDLSYELAGLLRNWLGGLGGPAGAGEGGGLLSSLGGMLGGMLGGARGTPGIGFGQPGIGFGQSGFAGKFATGGTIPKGQWGIVGDPARSGEPVRWSPSGIEVMPNSTLRALRSLRAPPAQRAGGSVSMSMSVSLAGANGDSALRAAMQQAAALGAKQAIETVNRSAPLRQVRLEQLGHVGA